MVGGASGSEEEMCCESKIMFGYRFTEGESIRLNHARRDAGSKAPVSCKWVWRKQYAHVQVGISTE